MECQDEHALLTQWTAITCHIVLILKTRLSSHVLPLKQYVKKHIQTEPSKSFNHVLHNPFQQKTHTPSSSFVADFPMVYPQGRYIHRHDGVTTKGGILRSNTPRETCNSFLGTILFFNKYPVKWHCFFFSYVCVCMYIIYSISYLRVLSNSMYFILWYHNRNHAGRDQRDTADLRWIKKSQNNKLLLLYQALQKKNVSLTTLLTIILLMSLLGSKSLFGTFVFPPILPQKKQNLKRHHQAAEGCSGIAVSGKLTRHLRPKQCQPCKPPASNKLHPRENDRKLAK